MRDLVFKNLTSWDKKRKILCSSEVMDSQGVHSVIRRHFVCVASELEDNHAQAQRLSPYIYILRKRNNHEQSSRFFYRIKGSIYAINNKKLFLIRFMHSLRINLTAIPQNIMQ